MITFSDYRHIIPIQIRFSDVDRLNHVNNACYHNYVELGRVQYFDTVLQDRVRWNTEGFMLARTEMDHIEQVYLTDEIYCCTRVYRFGNKSMGIRNSIIKRQGSEVVECAAVNAVLVAMDLQANVSIPVPEGWKKLIGKFEGIDF
jgi:acyl-CoA thioester hydrolase